MKLTENFDREEFDCKCGCGLNNIALHFVQKLQLLRDNVSSALGRDQRLDISSGCRCPVWNKHEGGAKKSAHLFGLGADIECTNSHLRFLIVAVAVILGFKRIAIGKTFIHLDLGEDLPSPRIWVY